MRIRVRWAVRPDIGGDRGFVRRVFGLELASFVRFLPTTGSFVSIGIALDSIVSSQPDKGPLTKDNGPSTIPAPVGA